MRKFKLGFIVLVTFFMAQSYTAFSNTKNVQGIWITEDGKGAIKIMMKNGTLVGYGAKVPGIPERYDSNNPDPNLRKTSLLKTKILWGFSKSDEAGLEWEGGEIYDPNNGKTYSSELEVQNDELHIRGYIGIPMFGRTTVWKRKK